MKFKIDGYVRPSARLTKGMIWTDRGQKHMSCKSAIAMQVKNQMALNDWNMLPERKPLKVEIALTTTKNLHKNDIDNLYKMITDAMQGIVYKNDSWIDCIAMCCKLGPEDETFVTVEVIDKNFIQKWFNNFWDKIQHLG